MTTDIDTRRVKDDMTKLVVSVAPEDSVLEALNTMAEYRVSTLPVTDGKNRCIGVLSTTDLVDPSRWRDVALETHTLGERTVSDLMTATVESVDLETPLLAATAMMLRQRVHHLPVVDKKQKLLGILSTMDLLAAFYNAHDQ